MENKDEETVIISMDHYLKLTSFVERAGEDHILEVGINKQGRFIRRVITTNAAVKTIYKANKKLVKRANEAHLGRYHAQQKLYEAEKRLKQITIKSLIRDKINRLLKRNQ